jgi:hypothetical protein
MPVRATKTRTAFPMNFRSLGRKEEGFVLVTYYFLLIPFGNPS